MHNLWKGIKHIMAGLLIVILVLTGLTYTAGVFAKSKIARRARDHRPVLDAVA